jgi:hypothetical protein
MPGFCRIFPLLVAASAALTAPGCQTVAPYERGTLARPDMQLGGAKELAESERHATEVREGSIGGLDAAGGGCGCN